MRSTVEPLEGNKVKLSVEVEAKEFEKAVDAAFKTIARQVAIPGFRPGKAPRRILEARVGPGYARQEALREALPGYYADALRANEVDAIAQPEIEITGGADEGPVTFDAVVEVRPTVALEGYGGLRVELPSLEVTEEDVDAQVERLRNQFADLVPADRPAQPGDLVRMDLKATRVDGDHDDVIDDVQDYLHEIGSQSGFPKEVDEHLTGASEGDVLEFRSFLEGTVPDDGEDHTGHDHAEDKTFDFVITVKSVQAKLLPDVTDEWAEEASEFTTVEELRADLRTRLASSKRAQALAAQRDGALEKLVELVQDDAPEALVEEEVQRRVQDLAMTLQRQGADLGAYLSATGMSGPDLLAQLREAAVGAVKADLALRSLAELEELTATDDEVDEEIARLAPQMGRSAAQLRRELDKADRLPAVRSDVRKAKALEWLLAHVELVDADGNPVDRAKLEAPAQDAEAQEDPDTETALMDENEER